MSASRSRSPRPKTVGRSSSRDRRPPARPLLSRSTDLSTERTTLLSSLQPTIPASRTRWSARPGRFGLPCGCPRGCSRHAQRDGDGAHASLPFAPSLTPLRAGRPPAAHETRRRGRRPARAGRGRAAPAARDRSGTAPSARCAAARAAAARRPASPVACGRPAMRGVVARCTSVGRCCRPN